MPAEHLITDLARVGRGERLEVWVDGERAWKISRALVAKLGLAVGQRLSPAELAQTRQAIELLETQAAALRALGQRARTRADLRQRLLAKGCPEAAVESALAWLADRGLVDDELYAQDRVTSLRRRRLGSRVIEHKLRLEGVPQDLTKSVMAERADELHETELARELAAQLSERWQAQDWPRRRGRIYQHLVRRGFPSEAIVSALSGLEPEDSSSEEM